MCENAIQYVTDTELDVGLDMGGRGTICHEQYREETWAGSIKIRSPLIGCMTTIVAMSLNG
ncbi:hypothetical protein ACI2OX_06365 [Bacillus sp. N9]